MHTGPFIMICSSVQGAAPNKSSVAINHTPYAARSTKKGAADQNVRFKALDSQTPFESRVVGRYVVRWGEPMFLDGERPTVVRRHVVSTSTSAVYFRKL